MKAKYSIEEIFKNNFENYTEQVPSDIWVNIENRLPLSAGNTNKKSKIKSISIFAGVLLFIAGISSTVIFFTEKNSEKTVTYQNTKNNNISVSEHKSDSKSINIEVNIASNNNTLKQTTEFKKVCIKEETTQILYTNNYNNENFILADKSYTSENGIERIKNDSFQINQINILEEGKIKPTVAFIIDKKQGCAPFDVSFKNISENTESYLWDFGNGLKSTEKSPVTVYEKSGEYSVTLTGESETGTATYQVQISVKESPDADFNILGESEKNAEEAIVFVNKSKNATKYKWNFGDRGSSKEFSPVYRYKNKGVYDIKLEAWAENGCKDSVIFYDFVVKNSKYTIFKPTAFTPLLTGPADEYIGNQKYQNDIFFLKFQTEVKDFKFRIQDRNGFVVYESKSVDKGWNGYYNNRLLSEGVYLWECAGEYVDGKKFYDFGSVTLLHTK